jgi:hypothetical protein
VLDPAWGLLRVRCPRPGPLRVCFPPAGNYRGSFPRRGAARTGTPGGDCSAPRAFHPRAGTTLARFPPAGTARHVSPVADPHAAQRYHVDGLTQHVGAGYAAPNRIIDAEHAAGVALPRGRQHGVAQRVYGHVAVGSECPAQPSVLANSNPNRPRGRPLNRVHTYADRGQRGSLAQNRLRQ